jgi:uncharacterized membrane protein
MGYPWGVLGVVIWLGVGCVVLVVVVGLCIKLGGWSSVDGGFLFNVQTNSHMQREILDISCQIIILPVCSQLSP